MKTSKRVLSVFMAMLIVIMSVSAGFVAFAAEDPYQVLADALKADGVKNAAWGSPQNYVTVVDDPTGDITKAVEAFWAVATAEAPNHTNSGAHDDYNTAAGIVDVVLDKLQKEPYNVTGTDLATAESALTAFVGGMTGRNQNQGSWGGKPEQPKDRAYGITVRYNIISVLLAQDADISNLPDTVVTEVSYLWNHKRAEWSTGSWIKTWYACNYLESWNNSENAGGADEIAALKAFGAYFTDDLLKTDLVSMTSAELAELAKKNQAAIDALGGLWGQDALIDHFFGDKDTIQNFVIATINARDNKLAEEYAVAIKDKMDKNDPVGMDLESLKTLLDEMYVLRANFNACGQEAKDAALEKVGLTAEAIDSYITSVNEEKEVLELQGFKATIDATIGSLVIEGNDKDTILDALKVVKEQYEMVTNRTKAAIDRVFTDGTTYVTDFITACELEIKFIELQEAALVDYFVYFNADLFGMDLTKISTDELIDNYLKTAEEKLTAINAYDQVTIDRVFGEKYGQITAYVESIYTTLTARLEAQISVVADNYDEVGKVNLLNHNEVEEAVGAVEARIWDVISSRASEELKADYAKVAPMTEALAEYNANFRDHYAPTEMEYPSRDPMAGDVARTSDEIYEVTNEKLNTVITKLDSLMGNEEIGPVLGIEGTISDLIKNAINDNLYTDEMVNTLVTTIYPMIVDTLKEMVFTEILGVKITGSLVLGAFDGMGIYVYPNNLTKAIDANRYPEVVAALNAAGEDWTQFDSTVSWGVHDKDTFIAAVGQALGGFTPLLRTALGDKNFSGKVIDIIFTSVNLDVSPMNLYNNDILPLLEVLECENVVPTSTFNTYSTSEDMMRAILDPLLTWVDSVADAPVSSLIDVLPKFAYILDHDMITTALKDAKVNASVIGMDVLSIAGIEDNSLYGILSFALPDLDLSILSDVNKLIPMVLSLVAPDSNLVLPTINQAVLASHGQMVSDVASGRTGGTRYQLITDKADTLLAVLRYILPMLGDNDFLNSVTALVGKLTGSEIVISEDILKIVNGIGLNADNVICAVTELFIPYEDYASKEIEYAFFDKVGETINNVTYTDDWTQEKAQYFADHLTGYIDNLILVLQGSGAPTLSELIKGYITGNIYTNDTVTSIVLMVKDALGGIGIDLAPVLGAIGLDISVWDDVTEGYNWGFTDGDKDGFAAALTKAFSPFAPVLAAVLAGEDFDILGTAEINGYYGYQNGIIPILEGLGCNPDDILSADEYVAAVQADQNAALSAILKPILNLVEAIYNDPVNKLLEILPNALYFINSDGLQVSVENAAQAAFVMLDTARPIYDISFNLDLDITQIIINALANLEIDGQPVNIKIPFLYDLNMLTVGTITEYTSKSGKTAYRLTDAAEADVITVLMRNLIEIAFYEDNINTVADIIADKTNMSDDLNKNLRDILNVLARLYKEDNGVDKTLNAIYVLFRGTDTTLDNSVSIIKGFNERWSAVFQKFYNSGNEYLIELAKFADKTLDTISLGLINGSGVGTNGLIDFFSKLTALFQGRVYEISIDRTEADMFEGNTLTLKATVGPSVAKNKNVIWASSNAAVATVSGGVVTAVGPGETLITATTEDGGYTVSCVVRVRSDKTALTEAVNMVNGAGLTDEQITDELRAALETADFVLNSELATQAQVNAALEELLNAYYAINLGTRVTDVTITQNGAPVGEVVYQKVSWTKKWDSTPVTLGLSVNEGADIKSVSWEYAKWSADDQQATIEAADDGTSAVIRATNGIGARSAWIQVTVEDVYGNKITSDPVKVRFYNWDWQK